MNNKPWQRRYLYIIAEVLIGALAGLFIFLYSSFSALADEPKTVLGIINSPLSYSQGKTVETLADARSQETTLSSAAADAAKIASQADIVVLCGGDFCRTIDAGAVTYSQVESAFSGCYNLAVVHINSEQLYTFLEYCLSHVVVGENEYIDYAASAFDGFPCISGFTLRYDPTAPSGERIMTIKLDDGTVLDRVDSSFEICLCTTLEIIEGKYGFVCDWTPEIIGYTEADALAEYIAAGIEINYNRVNRIKEYGVNNNSIYSQLPVGIVFMVILIYVLANGQKYRKHFYFNR